ncbi:MAG: methyl-accepting chemotaxis protein [Burkholderiaceae bacterium]
MKRSRSASSRGAGGVAAVIGFGAVVVAALAGAWIAGGGLGLDGRRAAVFAASAVVGVGLMAALIVYRVARQACLAGQDAIGLIRETVERVQDGDFAARTGIVGADPIGRLASALDSLLEERLATLERMARESEELNDSVIEIMQAVGGIATSKDLTRRVPVTENVTGAVSDALNLLTEEMGRVLRNVAQVSHEVARATLAVKGQSENARKAAARERREIEAAASELSTAAQALTEVAAGAQRTHEAAGGAVKANAEAMHSVSLTMQGVLRSRELIRESEKRVKRLGERSQEIGQVVGLIRSIAARTGVLALNASMHAAAAGESVRSFGQVADEVRRLSDSVQEATEQISRQVAAIQGETGETVRAVNDAIAQVVEITRLAEVAREEMARTKKETEALAAEVRAIAATSQAQARASSSLTRRARLIEDASAETARELGEQAVETRRLAGFARALLEQVRVFKVER